MGSELWINKFLPSQLWIPLLTPQLGSHFWHNLDPTPDTTTWIPLLTPQLGSHFWHHNLDPTSDTTWIPLLTPQLGSHFWHHNLDPTSDTTTWIPLLTPILQIPVPLLTPCYKDCLYCLFSLMRKYVLHLQGGWKVSWLPVSTSSTALAWMDFFPHLNICIELSLYTAAVRYLDFSTSKMLWGDLNQDQWSWVKLPYQTAIT